jgi:hypothetical protein
MCDGDVNVKNEKIRFLLYFFPLSGGVQASRAPSCFPALMIE